MVHAWVERAHFSSRLHNSTYQSARDACRRSRGAIRHVPPLYNQLTVFDARLPHGVRRVEGERDPRGARLVVHGWFTEVCDGSSLVLRAPLLRLYSRVRLLASAFSRSAL